MYGLTNEQILFMYYSLKVVDERYKSVIQTHKVSQQVFINGFQRMETKLPAELIHELETSEHYKMLRETMNVLHPIAELIEDVEPEMAKRTYQLFL